MPQSTAALAFSPPSIEDALAWNAEWPPRFAEFVLQAQQMQLQFWLAWQEGFAAINREMWDQWTCRWAGGAPIDA
jgi:hypothetical protein